MGKFEKGHPKFENQGKRGKGKFTTLKAAFINAFNNIGGEEALTKFAKTGNRNQLAFFQMISKMLPTNTKTEIEGEIQHNISMKKIVSNMDNDPE